MTIDNGVFTNAGQIYVSGTNAITNENGSNTTNILTNTGALEVAGTLTLDTDLVTNAGGIITVDDGKTLKLNGTTINGGTINDFSTVGGGIIDVTGASTIAGTVGTDANLNGNGAGTVTLDAALTLDYVTIDATAITDDFSIAIADTVTLQDGTTVTGGALSIGSSGHIATLHIENGTGNTAATLDNVSVNNTYGTIKVDVLQVSSTVTLVLTTAPR